MQDALMRQERSCVLDHLLLLSQLCYAADEKGIRVVPCVGCGSTWVREKVDSVMYSVSFESSACFDSERARFRVDKRGTLMVTLSFDISHPSKPDGEACDPKEVDEVSSTVATSAVVVVCVCTMVWTDPSPSTS